MNGQDTLNIGVIGNADQSTLMRLAGVTRYRVLDENDRDFRDMLRKALKDFAGDSEIALIIIPETWQEHVDDMVRDMRKKKRITTVVVATPSSYAAEPENVKEYYKAYTRRMIGFNIEI
ncbi:MAG: V-type ATP synthase subunit F [Deltaproteobacteria bacterium]|nr:V-type ATP synthase subunit F [Deltaproteobacteria bacterium]